MKIKTMALSVTGLWVALSLEASAGGFTDLPNTAPLRVNGAGINAADPLFLGFDVTFSGLLPSTFTLLDARQTTVIDPEDNLEVGTFFDRVYRDTTDNKLVFASRIELTLDDQGFNAYEVNDIQRAGFNGFNVAVAWWDATGADYRLKSAARSAQGFEYLVVGGTKTSDLAPDVYNADVVDMSTDTSGPEGNPLSAWYFIKTDAVGYALQVNAANVYSGNQDVSPDVVNRYVDAFVPTAAVPEPSSYALMLAGLGFLVAVQRRRQA